MKQKLKYIIVVMFIITILLNISNVYAEVAAVAIRLNPMYLFFENYFLILAFIVLLIILLVYLKKNKKNDKRIRNIIIIMIIGIILSIILYKLGLRFIPYY